MNKKIKIASLGDIHVKETSQGAYKELFKKISEKAQILTLAGDLCDLGLPKEAEVLAEELNSLTIPVVGVFGNHDYQSDNVEEVRTILTQAGLQLLGTEPVEIEGVGFAGVKGFGGGFEKYMLGSFGEPMIKQWVQETLNEVLALENQLKQIEAKKKVVIMHYAPISQTLEGESPEIFPFLGSSRFLEPIENFEVNAVFHGHAHHGTYEGKTPKGIPVYNVARLIMEKRDPESPFALIEI